MSSASPLVQSLVAQHRALAKDLERFAKAVPSSREIAAFAERLTSHLSLEDKELYGELERRGATTRAVSAGFQSTMKQLVRSAEAFIGKWTKREPASASKEFAEELALVSREIGKRIETEESKLYPLFDQSA